VCVNRDKQILHCSQAFYGTANDKTIAANDAFTQEIEAGKYDNISYNMYQENGAVVTRYGGTFVTDGGYTKIRHVIMPEKYRMDVGSRLFSEWIESIRKDVECTFGILKSRFRILHNRIRYHDWSVIENAMHTACILHNMILKYREANIEWEENVNWDTLDPDVEEPIENSEQRNLACMESENVTQNAIFTYERTGQGFETYDEKFNAMKEHFLVSYSRGEITWIRGIQAWQRRCYEDNRFSFV